MLALPCPTNMLGKSLIYSTAAGDTAVQLQVTHRYRVLLSQLLPRQHDYVIDWDSAAVHGTQSS